MMSTTGRNDPCPCGSGKKFKKCCMNLVATPSIGPLADAGTGNLVKAGAPQPDSGAMHNALGNNLLAQGKLDEAMSHYRKAIRFNPSLAEAHYNLGSIFHEFGQLDEAIKNYRRAISLEPDHADAYYNLGVALQDQNRQEEALASYQKTLSIKPDYAAARNNLGAMFHAKGRMDEALNCFRQGQAAAPDHFEWQLRSLGVLIPPLADSREHIAHLRARLGEEIERLFTQEGRVHTLEHALFNLFYLAYQGENDRPFMERIAGLVQSRAPALTRSLLSARPSGRDDGRLHVGFLSDRFYDHTISRLNQGYIRNLDRSRFHVTVIHAPGCRNDAMHQAINGMADATLYLPYGLEASQQRIASLGLDILHYADIGMAPYTYFLAYARLAPVQTVSWGHPVTTGLDSMDYFLSAGPAEPESSADQYTETLVRLNHFVNYDRIEVPTHIESRASLGLPEHGNLYGCLQSLFKFHPDFDAILADILTRDPEGWIIILEDRDGQLSNQLKRRWAGTHPILLERTVFLPPQPHARYLMLLSHMNVQLDPPHFGSGNTMYESFAFGIPIITWPSNFLRGRLVIGMYRWLNIADAPVAASLDDYAPLAVAYANDTARREAFKHQINEQAAKIYQDTGAVHELEVFFERAIAASRRGEKLQDWTPLNPT